jgi:beta-fructofuranosidase
MKRVTVHPGETVTVFQEEGTRAITSIVVSLDLGNLVTLATLDRDARVRRPLRKLREFPDTPEDRNVLRELVLAMYWDGEKHPSVWSPLGDFFGTTPGWNEYLSLPMGMAKDRFYSYWYMPFENGAVVTICNEGEKPRTLQFDISHAPVIRNIHTLARFHAKWHRDVFLPDEHGRREKDWTLLKTKGRGRFCGTMLHVNNPLGDWWGEGDEKFFVDEEKFPSIFGTGTDAYFGLWANHFRFYEAFHAHTATDREMLHKGHECLNRWHIADNIPFQKSLEAAFGKVFSNSRPTLYAATVYWYLAAGQQDAYGPVPVEERIGYWPGIDEFGITNTLEGEDLNIVSHTGGTVAPQHVAGLQTGAWSGLRGKVHLWWEGAEPGNTLKLSFPVERDGDYKLRMQFIKGDDYGRFQLRLDDNLLRDSLDLSHRGLIPSGPVDLGVHRFIAGQHTLEIVVTGSSPLVSDACQFGLDYLQLEDWDGSRNPELKAHHVYAGPFEKIYGMTSDVGRSRSINDHCFIREPSGLWHFFGIGGWPGFAHGTAETLLQKPWENQPSPFKVEWNPWKEVHLWAPHVVKDGRFYMFYCAGGKDGATFQMHLATSPDLRTWTKHPENPLFVDGFDGRDPMVLRVGNQWVMYYCANSDPTGGNHVVAYRISDDLIHWSERMIAFVDPGRQKAGGPTESPFVVRRGDTYYLFIGPREGYVGTDVFASKDPFRWYLEDRVGHIDSHAAEVVRDEQGQWYVSHAGSGQGGLYLAPLYWNDGLDEADASIPIPGIEDN